MCATGADVRNNPIWLASLRIVPSLSWNWRFTVPLPVWWRWQMTADWSRIRRAGHNAGRTWCAWCTMELAGRRTSPQHNDLANYRGPRCWTGDQARCGMQIICTRSPRCMWAGLCWPVRRINTYTLTGRHLHWWLSPSVWTVDSNMANVRQHMSYGISTAVSYALGWPDCNVVHIIVTYDGVSRTVYVCE